MIAIKKARKRIESSPQPEAATTLSQLVRALDSGENFAISDLYELDYADFNLAIDILKAWRLDRYYMGEAKLHDLSVHVAQIDSAWRTVDHALGTAINAVTRHSAFGVSFSAEHPGFET